MDTAVYTYPSRYEWICPYCTTSNTVSIRLNKKERDFFGDGFVICGGCKNEFTRIINCYYIMEDEK